MKPELKIHTTINSIFYNACVNNYIKIVESLLKDGVDANFIIPKKEVKWYNFVHKPIKGNDSILMRSSFNGHIEITKLLLEHGANSNYVGMKGDTGLTMSCYDNSVECIPILLKHGANINHQNDKGETVLIKASMLGNVKTVEMLLKYNPNIYLKDKLYYTCYTTAQELEKVQDERGVNYTKIMKLLINHEYRVIKENKFIKTFIDKCCPICQEDYETDSIVTTKCGHIFHHNCAIEFIKTECPICRQSL